MEILAGEIVGKFIHIRSDKFPVLPGEDKEIINDGMYGKALAEYLQKRLTERGYKIPFICAEDWGWWVELDLGPIRAGVCIFSLPETSDPIEYVCTDGFKGNRKWSWSKFRLIDTTHFALKLHEDLVKTFQEDREINIVAITDEFPY